MTRLFTVALACLAAASALADTKPAPTTEVAIIHYDKLSEAKLDGTVSDVGFDPMVGSSTELPGLHLVNLAPTRRTIIVRIMGLTGTDYDVYMDISPDGTRKKTTVFSVPELPPQEPKMADYLVGSMTREQLEAGIPVTLPGSMISASDRDYYARLLARAQLAVGRYPSDASSIDTKKCRAALTGIVSWINDSESGDRDAKTVRLAIAPNGKPFTLPTGAFMVPLAPQYRDVFTIGSNLQILRKNIHDEVNDQMSRNDVLQALTPIDVKLVVGKTVSVPGRHVVKVVIQNWTDQPVSGKVVLYGPQGVKVKPISPLVKISGYSKLAGARFEVVTPKSGKPAATFSAVAELNVGGVEVPFVAVSDQ